VNLVTVDQLAVNLAKSDSVRVVTTLTQTKGRVVSRATCGRRGDVGRYPDVDDPVMALSCTDGRYATMRI